MISCDTIASGRLFWITGLAGAGKTTIGRRFFEEFRRKAPNSVFLDGDTLRNIFGYAEKAYTLPERRKLAFQYARLAKELTEQEINVVICTISMFQDVRDWMRRNVPGYYEIYVKVPIETLIERDQKKLYSRALKGEVNNVMGVDISFEEPKNPDIVIFNPVGQSLEEIHQRLVKRFINT